MCKTLLMTRFEPESSGVGSDHSNAAASRVYFKLKSNSEKENGHNVVNPISYFSCISLSFTYPQRNFKNKSLKETKLSQCVLRLYTSIIIGLLAQSSCP